MTFGVSGSFSIRIAVNAANRAESKAYNFHIFSDV